jgi:uncharacterized membrane protein
VIPNGLIPVLAVLAVVAGTMSYLTAYHQLTRAHAAPEARRRALGATVGPVVFYGFLGAVLFMGVPLMLHP